MKMKRLVIVVLLVVSGMAPAVAQHDNRVVRDKKTARKELGMPESTLKQSEAKSGSKRTVREEALPKTEAAGTDTLPNRKMWTAADDKNTLLRGLAKQQEELDRPDGIGLMRSGVMGQAGALTFYGTGLREEHPGMLSVRTALVGMGGSWGNVDYRLQGAVNRYSALGITTQYGLGGTLTWHISDNLSATVFGNWYNRNPYFFMATFPFVQTSNYGGFLTANSGRVGLKAGARSYYDPFQRQWKVEPIVSPMLRVSSKFTIEVPLGPLLQNVLEHTVFRSHREGPNIMPSVMH